VTAKTITATQSIAYKTVYQNDSSLEKGKQTIAQNGKDGVKTITYKETYENGKLSSKTVVSSEVTKYPVNKIIKVGTKVVQSTSSYLSASQAKSILSSSGLFKKSSDGNTFTYAVNSELGSDVIVRVGSNHVSSINYSANDYLGWDMSLSQCIDIFGKEDGPKEYQYAQNGRHIIEQTVRAATNAVYGSGSSKANALYSQIINSEGFNKSF